MEKINCNVIQDILPLYIDDVVSDDTKELVEEHLQNCEICQRVYHETKTDLENDMKISAPVSYTHLTLPTIYSV